MKLTPKPENLAKLTPEQKKVYEAWVEEDAEAEVIFQGLLDAIATNNKELLAALTDQLTSLIPSHCEHGRTIHLPCMACDEIEKILFPDSFDADGNFIENETFVQNDFVISKKSKKWLN